MLAIQTADHLLYVPERDIASLTPVYPNRTRVVLADGTVAHRPGSRQGLNPAHLRKQGKFWLDPADYKYPHKNLRDWEQEQEPSQLEPEFLYLERIKRAVHWQTASGPTPCLTTFDKTLQLFPELSLINRNQAVPLRRFRKITTGPKENFTLTLDTGTELVITKQKAEDVAEAVGCSNLKAIDAEESAWLSEVRDTPYDLLNAAPQRLRTDFPDFRRLVLNILWRNVLLYQSGKLQGTLRSMDQILQGPVTKLSEQLGYPIDQHLFENTFKLFMSREQLGNFRQLGFADPGPERRRLGSRFPDSVLLAPLGQKDAVLPAAERSGLSCYLAQGSKRLHLEFFAQMLLDASIRRIRLLAWGVDSKTVDFLREDLEQSEIEVVGPTGTLTGLDFEVPLEPIPPPEADYPQPTFSRIALQQRHGLLLVEPEEIASWTPALPDRWRVVTADGTVAYHPGPVPAGPWVVLGSSYVLPRLLRLEGTNWVDPANFRYPGIDLPTAVESPPSDWPTVLGLPANQILRLERRVRETVWHFSDETERVTDWSIEEAAALHSGLVRLNHDNYFNGHALRSTYQKNHTYQLILDNGLVLSYRRGRYNHRLPLQLGLSDLFELGPDTQMLRRLQIRDYPYEIARAKADVLKRDFLTADQPISNLIWQAYCMHVSTGKLPYGDDFVAFFYMPLQATLYRAGFLTRSQLKRSPEKERLSYRFEYILAQMVRRCRLFNYQQFGFKDVNANQRVLGDRLPGVLLLVEKGGSIEDFARRLQAEFGFSLLLLGGMPSMRDSEYFERDLARVYQGPLDVLAYTDFDNFGYRISSGFVKQMDFLGRACRSRQHLVVAACFTPEEQVLYARPLPTSDPEQDSNNTNWVRETGGVAGMPLGIHANLLEPFERVRSRLLEILPC